VIQHNVSLFEDVLYVQVARGSIERSRYKTEEASIVKSCTNTNVKADDVINSVYYPSNAITQQTSLITTNTATAVNMVVCHSSIDSSTDSAANESDAATKGSGKAVNKGTSCRSLDSVTAAAAEKRSSSNDTSSSLRFAPDVMDGILPGDELHHGITATHQTSAIRYTEDESSTASAQYSSSDSLIRVVACQKTPKPLLTSTPKSDQGHGSTSDDLSLKVNNTSELTTGNTLVYVITLQLMFK